MLLEMPIKSWLDIKRRQYVHSIDVGDYIWVEPSSHRMGEIAALSLVLEIKKDPCDDQVLVITLGEQGQRREWYLNPESSVAGIFRSVF